MIRRERRRRPPGPRDDDELARDLSVFDITMIGIGPASEGILRRLLFGELPETVGAEFEGEVVMVRKHRPVQSAVKRFIGKWIGKGAKATTLGK